MNRKIVVGLGMVTAFIVAAVVLLLPSIRYYSAPAEQRMVLVRKEPTIVKHIINLGLDLQGGMRLVLEVDRSALTPEQQKDVLDRAYTVVENRINALGVAEPTIQKQGQNRLIVELPGLKDEGMAKSVIGKTAQLQFMLQRETPQLERAVRIVDKVLGGGGLGDTTSGADTTKAKTEEAQSMGERLFGGTEQGDTSAAAAKDTTGAAVPTTDAQLLQGVTSFRKLLIAVGEQVGASFADQSRVDAVLRRRDVRTALENAGLGENIFLWSHDTTLIRGAQYRKLYYLKGKPEMAGDVIKDAWQSMDQSGLSGGYEVELELNKRGASKFGRVTGANIGKNLAIVLDSTVYSAPVIRSKIPFGRAQITGSFTMDEAKSLAIVLRAGAMPAPVTIVEERLVGPSLGQDSIHDGLMAGLVGAICIFIFMVFYYRMSGTYAVLALLLNVLFVLAVMAGINQTLTLPGIAGLVLNLAMAVDANVLICERIREELAIGKTVRSAIDTGYKRVFVVILDSNLTMLFKAGILFWIGTGPIKGFAVTLTFGLIISMYTALSVTHLMYNIFSSKSPTKLSI